jgi:hypothetical protein
VIADLDASSERPGTVAYVKEQRAKLVRAVATDGWEFDGTRFDLMAGKHHLAQLSASAAKLNAPELDRQLSRMRDSVEADPALTLGTAKEIIETAWKTILEEHGRKPGSDWDVGRLVREMREALKLLPSDIGRTAMTTGRSNSCSDPSGARVPRRSRPRHRRLALLARGASRRYDEHMVTPRPTPAAAKTPGGSLTPFRSTH